VRVEILGSSGFAPSASRETACALARDGELALLLDAGTGARRLLTDANRLAGVERLDVLLTHFHLDHVCGLPYLSTLGVDVALWGPGVWLYGRPTAEILAPLLQPPISPGDVTDEVVVNELAAGEQTVGGFRVRASPQPNHWAPTAGLRIDDALALITDTPYEPTSAELAAGVVHLLHEAWSSSAAPKYPEHDATAADAARVALEAGAGSLTLIHLNPRLPDLSVLLDDARAFFAPVELGDDEMILDLSARIRR
jgi:ribonuclease BN (tRNA processing enzyme)